MTIFTKTGVFPGPPIRASFFKDKKQDRSESTIAVNPLDNQNLVGASKLFTDPPKYKFVVAAIFSLDGGFTWKDSAPLKIPAGIEGFSDPALAFDKNGVAWLLTEPLIFNYDSDPDHDPSINTDILIRSMVVYKSTDKGATWGDPFVIDQNQANEGAYDKPWLAVDQSNGNLYVAWGFGELQFARSTNGAVNWSGLGNKPIDTPIGFGAGPEINVGTNGHIHIVSHSPGTSNIRYQRSTDAGMSLDPEQFIAVGLTDLDTGIMSSGFAKFPSAKFRVLTLATACSVPNQDRVAVAWADFREGHSRIYYTMSTDSGATWPGDSGNPLLGNLAPGDKFHDFHPQIIAAGNGTIGCAFYRYYEISALIDVMFTVSFDSGQTFENPEVLNSQPWDPAVNAPFSHQNPNTTFIGDYFGLDADAEQFHVLWTNTQDGVQELYYNVVATTKEVKPYFFDAIYAELFGGVASDGGGFVIVNGHYIKIPPREPIIGILHALAALDALKGIRGVSTTAMQKSLLNSIATIARNASKEIR